jgi:transposase
MGGLERRARRLEEQAELDERARQIAAEFTLREALKRVSTAELLAMKEAFDRPGPEEWTEEDLPLMLRLLGLMDEVRAEEAAVRTGEFPWQTEMREQKEQIRGD